MWLIVPVEQSRQLSIQLTGPKSDFKDQTDGEVSVKYCSSKAVTTTYAVDELSNSHRKSILLKLVSGRISWQ